MNFKENEPLMKQVEFISYDGAYPNLCSGLLVLKINGVVKEFPRYCLHSGGSDVFITKGVFQSQSINGQNILTDNVLFEGWMKNEDRKPTVKENLEQYTI